MCSFRFLTKEGTKYIDKTVEDKLNSMRALQKWSQSISITPGDRLQWKKSLSPSYIIALGQTEN